MEVSRRAFIGVVGGALGFGAGLAVMSRLLGGAGGNSPAPLAAQAAPTSTAPFGPTTSISSTTPPITAELTAEPVPTSMTSPAAPETTTTTTEAPADPAATGPSNTAAAPLAAIPVICRGAWRGKSVRFPGAEHRISRLTVHHTAVRLDDNNDAPARIRRHQTYHMDAGWIDLAYHYLVDAHGHIYEGRPVAFAGDTFTDYDPAGHFLVVCEGNFDDQAVPEQQLAGLVDVLAWAARAFDVPVSSLGGHRDFASTTCPGDDLYARLDDVAARVTERAAEASFELEDLCGAVGAQLVEAIESGTDVPRYGT